MSYPLITATNITGLDSVFVYLNVVTGGVFMRMLLISVFCIMAFASFYIQKKNVGTGDLPVSFAVASWTTLIFGFMLRLIAGLVDNVSIGVLIVLALVSIGILMFSDETTA